MISVRARNLPVPSWKLDRAPGPPFPTVGPQGDVGPTGATGATGATGPAGPARLTSHTVSTLPASPTTGDLAAVTDATAPTFLGLLVGSGTTFTPVVYNGTAWVSF